MLGAIRNSQNTRGASALPVPDVDFDLPCDPITWQAVQANWLEPMEPGARFIQASRALSSGAKPAHELNDFGVLTLIAATLCQICSMQAICASDIQMPEVDRSLSELGDIWRTRLTKMEESSNLYEPMSHIVNSFICSGHYHLYAHRPLSLMKRALEDPSILDDTDALRSSLQKGRPERLQQAMTWASEAWRHDCQRGITYLKMLAPFKYSPISANSIFEGGEQSASHPTQVGSLTVS